MKKIIIAVLIICLLYPLKSKGLEVLNINSECAILMEQNSERIIYGKNINKSMLIASITKIMTAVIAIESKKLNNIVTVDETVLKSYGSNIYISIGEEMSLRDMVYGLMMKSGNDAAMMISKYISGSQEAFAILMNKKAQEIGMTNTIYRNSHGLDEETENYSTAYDMALLTKYAMGIPEYRKIVGTKKHIVKTNLKTYEWVNKNQLLFSYPYITGGKNGYTERANKTLVTTASKDNMDLIVVTLDDNNQWVTHKELHEYGFQNYKNYKILSVKNFKVVDDYFYKDKLYIKKNYYYPLKEEEKDRISVKVKIEKLNYYRDNEKVGVVEIYLDGKEMHSEDIYVDKKIKRVSIWHRVFNLF
jgi:D-alanyl-D-alanine carboxypeptidase